MCYGCRDCGKCGKPSSLTTAREIPCPACGKPQRINDDGTCAVCGERVAPPMFKPPGEVRASM